MQLVMPVKRWSISTVDNSLDRNFFSCKWKKNLALFDSLKNIINTIFSKWVCLVAVKT